MTTSATMPELVKYCIDLPFPVSANRLWSPTSVVHTRRGSILIGRRRHHLTPVYQSFVREADALYLAQKRGLGPLPTLGEYTLDAVFSRAKRSPVQDGDNLCKCLHDWCQRVELIHNDCLCTGGSWSWGEAETGCRVAISGYPWSE